MKGSLVVHSIFPSIDGEANQFGQGHLTTFIRLGGCNLRCPYCDTKETQEINNLAYLRWYEESYDGLMIMLQAHSNRKITITGGEPLLQQHAVLRLCEQLVELGHIVTIETNGTIVPVGAFSRVGEQFSLPRTALAPVQFVVDRKGPSSMSKENAPLGPAWWMGFGGSNRAPFVKYVISDAEDASWAFEDIRELWRQYRSTWARFNFMEPTVLISPCHGTISADRLVTMISEQEIHKLGNTLVNIQLHKFVGVP